jgi:hypothetical protein
VLAKITPDRGFDGRKKATLAKLRQEPKTPDLVLNGILEFREAQLDVSSL